MAADEILARYLDDLARHLALSPRARSRILAEVRDHLEQAASADSAGGISPANAMRRAVDRFGSVQIVAASFPARRATAGHYDRLGAITCGLLGIYYARFLTVRQQPFTVVQLCALALASCVLLGVPHLDHLPASRRTCLVALGIVTMSLCAIAVLITHSVSDLLNVVGPGSCLALALARAAVRVRRAG